MGQIILQGHKPYLIGLHYKGFIWDIPILIFAYVLFWALYGRGFKTGALYSGGLLGGSWVVIRQVFSPNMGYKLLDTTHTPMYL